MIGKAMAFTHYAFTACLDWFSTLLSSIAGSSALIVAAFFIFTLVSMLLLPLRGAGSDSVTRSVIGRNKNGKSGGKHE